MSTILSLRNTINEFLSEEGLPCDSCKQPATNMYLCDLDCHVSAQCTRHIMLDVICECGSGGRPSGDVIEIIDKQGNVIKDPVAWRKQQLANVVITRPCAYAVNHSKGRDNDICDDEALEGKLYCEEHDDMEFESSRCHHVQGDYYKVIRCESKVISAFEETYRLYVNSLYCHFHRSDANRDFCQLSYKCRSLAGHPGQCDQSGVDQLRSLQFDVGKAADSKLVRELLVKYRSKLVADKQTEIDHIISLIDNNRYPCNDYLFEDIDQMVAGKLSIMSELELMSREYMDMDQRLSVECAKALVIKYRPALSSKHQTMIDDFLERIECPKYDVSKVDDDVTEIIETD